MYKKRACIRKNTQVLNNNKHIVYIYESMYYEVFKPRKDSEVFASRNTLLLSYYKHVFLRICTCIVNPI